jgi:hypothetical protein
MTPQELAEKYFRTLPGDCVRAQIMKRQMREQLVRDVEAMIARELNRDLLEKGRQWLKDMKVPFFESHEAPSMQKEVSND